MRHHNKNQLILLEIMQQYPKINHLSIIRQELNIIPARKETLDIQLIPRTVQLMGSDLCGCASYTSARVKMTLRRLPEKAEPSPRRGLVPAARGGVGAVVVLVLLRIPLDKQRHSKIVSGQNLEYKVQK